MRETRYKYVFSRSRIHERELSSERKLKFNDGYRVSGKISNTNSNKPFSSRFLSCADLYSESGFVPANIRYTVCRVIRA